MNAKKKINYLLKRKIVILDGAWGTELYKRGMPYEAVPEVWALNNPSVLKAIHSEYKKAGSDIIYAATFGANRIKLSSRKIGNVKQINRDLCKLAKDVAGNNCLVAGDIGGLGVFIEPFGELAFEEAVNIFKEQIKGQLEGGVDLFVIETMIDIQETRAALLAVKELCDKFTIASMTFETSGRTLNGTTPEAALITLQSLGADCVGANCSTGPEGMLKIVKKLKPYAAVPLAVKPNAGMPKLINGQAHFSMGAKEFGSYAGKFARLGVNMFGGCCGTTPEHIREAKIKLNGKKPVKPLRKSISALSSSRSILSLENKKDILILGESINPTGKPRLQEELRKGKIASLGKLANEQKENGANLLDVNVGVPQADEVKLMAEAVSLLSRSVDLPLAIDSSNIGAVEKALRLYPGRALINSISGDKDKLKPLLGLAKKYGAMFIVLPIEGRKIPKSLKERKDIIKNILGEAKKFGFSREDLIIDCLVFTVSTRPLAAIDTLNTISWCKNSLGIKTIVGLSNISFGLPRRDIINATFLNMAKKSGLSCAIANPAQKKNLINPYARNLLLNKTGAAAKYILNFSSKADNSIKYKPAKQLTAEEELRMDIIEGNREGIIKSIRRVLASGKQAFSVMQDILIPAIVDVGKLFEKKEYFLPQLIASAEAMKCAAKILLPYLKKTGLEKKKAIVLLATVEGDVHDIGKNIVALLLENYGFKIVDLGKDVSAEKIIAAIKANRPQVVGLSALMTTTMVNMKKVIELASVNNLQCKFMVGGAVVTKAFASSINAGYAKDGMGAVRLVQELSKN